MKKNPLVLGMMIVLAGCGFGIAGDDVFRIYLTSPIYFSPLGEDTEADPEGVEIIVTDVDVREFTTVSVPIVVEASNAGDYEIQLIGAPVGWAYDDEAGVVSGPAGTPTTVQFEVRAVDSISGEVLASRVATVVSHGQPEIDPPSSIAASVGDPIVFAPLARNLIGTAQWSLEPEPGMLHGLEFDPATGSLSGSASQPLDLRDLRLMVVDQSDYATATSDAFDIVIQAMIGEHWLLRLSEGTRDRVDFLEPHGDGYLVSGQHMSPSSVFLGRLNSSNEFDWLTHLTYPSRDSAYLFDMDVAGDALYATGYAADTSSPAWLVKSSSNGATEIAVALRSGKSILSYGVAAASDGIDLAGRYAEVSGHSAFVARLDQNAQFQWSRGFYPNVGEAYYSSAQFNDVVVAPNGDVIAVGASRHLGENRGVVYRYDSQGGLVWARMMTGDASTAITRIESSPSGGYVIGLGGGSTVLGIAHMNDEGQITWSRKWTGAQSIQVQGLNVDGDGIMLLGNTRNTPGNDGAHNDGYVMRFGHGGELLSGALITGPYDDIFYAAASAGNGNVVLSGNLGVGSSPLRAEGFIGSLPLPPSSPLSIDDWVYSAWSPSVVDGGWELQAAQTGSGSPMESKVMTAMTTSPLTSNGFGLELDADHISKVVAVIEEDVE